MSVIRSVTPRANSRAASPGRDQGGGRRAAEAAGLAEDVMAALPSPGTAGIPPHL